MTSSVHTPTIAALTEALQDEYRSRATYRRVIEAFGPVRPFDRIVESEDRHVDALLRQFERLGVAPPIDDWSQRVETPHSLEEACASAVRAEVENAAMYDRLMTQVEDATVRETLLRLREASQERHLPAFRRCVQQVRAEDF